MRAPLRAAASAKAAQPRPEGTTFAPTWHSASSRRSGPTTAEKRPSPRRAMSSRKTRSTGSSAQNASTWSSVGVTVSVTAGSFHPVRVALMPIHLRAEPGDYADAVLLPGDPLRAKYIAETYFDDVNQVNEERGLLGYTGTWEGKRVSVQGTGMGCPGATIVFEELIQLGCKKLMRVGTCGGLQPHHALGDLVVALTAVPADATAQHLVDNEPHCPTASWELVHGAVHAAKELEQPMHVGPIVSSDVFYNPDGGQYERWSSRGVLAVEMEAAALFTVAALGGIGKVQGDPRRLPAHGVGHRRRGRVHADLRRRAARGGRPDDARRAHDRHLRLAQRPLPRQPGVRQRRDRQALAGAAATRRRAGLARRRGAVGVSRPPRAGGARGAGDSLLVVIGGDGTVNEVVNGIAGTDAEIAVLPCGTGQDFGRTHGIPSRFDDAVRVALDGETRTIDLGRVELGDGTSRFFANVGSAGMSGAVARRANSMTKRLGGRATFFYALTREFLAWQNTRVVVELEDGVRREGRCTT